MEKVGVARLKAGLCGYLKRARAGEEIIICDRQQPIARLAPLAEEAPGLADLHIRPGKGSLADWKPQNKVRVKEDIVALLLEDRRKR